MRARWKIMGGTAAISLCIAVSVVGQSRTVRGDDTTSSSTNASDPIARDPFAQYPTPGAIAYEQLTAAEQARVDHVQEVVETNQPATSHAAFANATAWARTEAERQRAERGVGLTDTAQDGVVP
jgi:hypothetical protein